MTRILLDACVLFPSVLRELLMGAAGAGLFVPLWSERILEEWRRAAARKDTATGAIAQTEILLLKARWPNAMVTLPDQLPTDIFLPDPDDVHVLTAAINGQATELLTANTRDFPARVLAQHNILRRHPDEFLLELAHSHPREIRPVVDHVMQNAAKMQDAPQNQRAKLRKIGLPRFAKHLAI